MAKELLIVAHAPSPNTRRLRDAAAQAGAHTEAGAVQVRLRPPLEAGPEDVLACDGILLGTPENLGTMSGALKDFFDRSYYPVLEARQGLPCGLYIRAGRDGTGTRRAVETIVTGLRWKWVQPPLVLCGEWREHFVDEVAELALGMAAGLDLGVL